jgi:RNA polymerase sigma-70 factor (ECF subfamily)
MNGLNKCWWIARSPYEQPLPVDHLGGLRWAVIQWPATCVFPRMTGALALALDMPMPAGRSGMDEHVRIAADDPAVLLLRVVRTRDREAFRALFLALAPRVKTYLIRLGVPPPQADELAQETFLAIWKRADQYRPERGSAAGWIFTIARNLRIDALRRERAAMAYDLAVVEPEGPATPEAETALVERQARLREAVRALPRDQIEVIELSFFADKPHAEIARDLSLPLGTVKSRLRLAVIKLRAVLGDLA